jgi:hypothetical protein
MGLNLVIELALNLARQLDEAYEQREVKVDPSFSKPPLKPKKSLPSLQMDSPHVNKLN